MPNGRGIYKRYASTYQRMEYSGTGVENQHRYLQINSAGCYDGAVPPGIINRPRGRRDYYLAYNCAGRSYIRRGTEVRGVKSGDIFLFHPGDPQIYWYDKVDYIKNYWVHFTGYGARELVGERLGIPSSTPYAIGFEQEISEKIERIIDEINGKRPGCELHAEGLLLQIIAILVRKRAENLPVTLSVRNENIYRSLEYIKANFSKDLRVGDLAAMAYLSINRYTNVFKELIGTTPQRYISGLRLQKSMELLQLTDWNVGQIAAAVGYSDQMYFSRVFKQSTGEAPTTVMKRLRGKE